MRETDRHIGIFAEIHRNSHISIYCPNKQHTIWINYISFEFKSEISARIIHVRWLMSPIDHLTQVRILDHMVLLVNLVEEG